MPDNKSMMTKLEALGPVTPNPAGEAAVLRLLEGRPDADQLAAIILGGAA